MPPRRFVATLGVNPVSEAKLKAKYDAVVVGGGLFAMLICNE
jgi:hypothetical protein